MDSQKPMKIVYRDVDSLVPYDKNPRVNADAVPFVARSIDEFGFRVPIVIDADGVIVCGHTRLEAAKSLGMKSVPCVMADDMTPEQVKAYRLADNKVSELSDWDLDFLADELSDIEGIDMEDFGFTPLDFGDFDDPDDDGSEPDDEDEIEVRDKQNPRSIMPDEEPEPEPEPLPDAEAVVKKGDIIELGRHRLHCGDSTSAEDMDALMDGATADIAFTSPPYNAGHLGTGRSQDGAKYLNDADERSDEDYGAFLRTSVDLMLEHSHEAFVNIGVLKGSKSAIIDLLYSEKDRFKDFIYWKKNNPVPALAKNHISSAVELIMAFGRDGSRMFRHDPGIWYGVIEGNWAGNNQFAGMHRATFPLYLPTEVINRMTDDDAVVLDPFGGTGTTLIACEDTGRTCYMQELEPQYCDLIVRRYIERVGGSESVHLYRDGKEMRVSWN